MAEPERELSPEAKAVFAGQAIMVIKEGEKDGTLYTHEAFLGAFQQALLDRIAMMVPFGTSQRNATRILASLRSPEAHQATLRSAIRLLIGGATPLPVDEISSGRRTVVAVFPA